MLELRCNPRSVVGLLLASALASVTFANSAQAIPYFNVDFGFDNSSLQLAVDYEIPTNVAPEILFPPVQSGNTSNDVGLLTSDVINDTGSSIDRIVTWTIINNDPSNLTEFILFLTALGTTPTDYSGANIDVAIDEFDPMEIADYGPYFFAGYRLTLDDFTLVSGDLIATRTFRYTVDVPEGAGGPPELGVAYTTMFTSVPEPATGLLLTGALLVASRAGRKRRA